MRRVAISYDSLAMKNLLPSRVRFDNLAPDRNLFKKRLGANPGPGDPTSSSARELSIHVLERIREIAFFLVNQSSVSKMPSKSLALASQLVARNQSA
jgi:hypothetical protein